MTVSTIPISARFDRLTVTGPYRLERGKTVGGHPRYRYWYPCRCDCGQTVQARGDKLLAGRVLSCGCAARDNARVQQAVVAERMRQRRAAWEVSHPHWHALYRRWDGMHKRCNDPHNPRYGGRGIQVCAEWAVFERFYVWAMSHGFSPELEIDRINNDGGYCPQNCRYVTKLLQQNNLQTSRWLTAWGVTKTLTGWVADPRCVISRSTLSSRYDDWQEGRWASVEQMLTTPAARQPRRRGPKGPGKLVAAWGVLQGLRAWMRDARVHQSLSDDTIRQRLRSDWPAELALSLPRCAQRRSVGKDEVAA